jgi:hypothetical protein
MSELVWVRRRASVERVCDSCWDVIPIDRTYYLLVTGERLCADCPPEDEGCNL